MVTSLSDFFRTTLSKGHDYITVKEERTHIESYLEIQQFRYQDILDYEIQMDGRSTVTLYRSLHCSLLSKMRFIMELRISAVKERLP